MKRRYGKPLCREPLAVTMRRNRAAMSAMVPEEKRARFEADFPESSLPALPKKRTPRAMPSTDIEAPVLSAVGELLAVHPRILFAVRQNSGSLPYDRDGRLVPVWFYKLIRVPEDVTIADYWGLQRDGKPFAFECKKPSWRSPSTDREKKQAAFLRMIECVGGIARFVTDVSQVSEAMA